MTTTIDPKTARGAHIVEHGEGWSPRGGRMRVARPADPEVLDLHEYIRAIDDDYTCAGCGFLLCSCPDDEAPPTLVDLPVEPATRFKVGDRVRLAGDWEDATITGFDEDGDPVLRWASGCEEACFADDIVHVRPSPSESLAGDGGWRVGDRVLSGEDVYTVVEREGRLCWGYTDHDGRPSHTYNLETTYGWLRDAERLPRSPSSEGERGEP